MNAFRFAEAQALFSKVLASKPRNARAHFGLGKMLHNQGKQAEAIKSFEDRCGDQSVRRLDDLPRHGL